MAIKSVRIKQGPAARAARLSPTSKLRKQVGAKKEAVETPKRCRCFSKIEKFLAEHHPHIKLDPIFVLSKRRSEPLFRIATEREKGSRKPHIAITPTYCPFCGVRTAQDEGEIGNFGSGLGHIKKRTNHTF